MPIVKIRKIDSYRAEKGIAGLDSARSTDISLAASLLGTRDICQTLSVDRTVGYCRFRLMRFILAQRIE